MPDAFTPSDPWPVTWTCDVSTYTPLATGKAVALASDILYGLTGRQFGYTTVKLRPCRNYQRDTPYPDAWVSWPGTMMAPLGATSSGGLYGYWMSSLCGSCASGCSCSWLEQIKLPAPVSSIVEVRIDGAPLVTGAYRVDDNRFLVRTDGSTWPLQNNLSLDDTQVGTWSVTPRFGVGVPVGADVAVGQLACELVKAISGVDCGLPREVTQLARQGVTIQLPNPADMFKNGLTGLKIVDWFINTWNPRHLVQRARTYSVDGKTIRRTGTTS